MRYLRQLSLNKRAPYDQRLYVDMTDSVVMGTSNNLLVPKGTTAQRPVSPVVGMVRYNTSTNELEVYEGSSANWRSVRYKESTGITQQSLGNIDGYTVYYGPLSPAPPTVVANGTTWGGQNIIVVVENVIQIFNTNYTITQNPTATVSTSASTTSGTTLTFSSTATIPNGSTVTGSANIPANTTVTVTSSTQVTMSNAVTGTVSSGTSLTFTSPAGYYITFVSDAYYIGLIGKPVIALIGFDQ